MIYLVVCMDLPSSFNPDEFDSPFLKGIGLTASHRNTHRRHCAGHFRALRLSHWFGIHRTFHNYDFLFRREWIFRHENSTSEVIHEFASHIQWRQESPFAFGQIRLGNEMSEPV